MPPQFRRQGRQEGQPAVDPVDAASAGAYLVVGVGGSVAIARSVVTVARAGVQALGDMQGRLAAPITLPASPSPGRPALGPWPSCHKEAHLGFTFDGGAAVQTSSSTAVCVTADVASLLHTVDLRFSAHGHCKPPPRAEARRSCRWRRRSLRRNCNSVASPSRFHSDPGCPGNPHSMQMSRVRARKKRAVLLAVA
jgi:hypothetical protein